MSTTLDTATKVKALYGGTWQAWGKGRVPVGVDPNDTDFNAPNKTGGSKTVTLNADQLPKHSFTTPHIGYMESSHTVSNGTISRDTNVPYEGTSSNVGGRDSWRYSFGNNKSHENMPPYQTLYYWLRTA